MKSTLPVPRPSSSSAVGNFSIGRMANASGSLPVRRQQVELRADADVAEASAPIPGRAAARPSACRLPRTNGRRSASIRRWKSTLPKISTSVGGAECEGAPEVRDVAVGLETIDVGPVAADRTTGPSAGLHRLAHTRAPCHRRPLWWPDGRRCCSMGWLWAGSIELPCAKADVAQTPQTATLATNRLRRFIGDRPCRRVGRQSNRTVSW